MTDAGIPIVPVETDYEIMSDEQRRINDGWERNENLVLKTLGDLRLSSDAALKMGSDLKEAFASMKAEVSSTMRAHQTEIDELKAWRLRMTNWVMGIVGTLIGSGVVWLVVKVVGK